MYSFLLYSTLHLPQQLVVNQFGIKKWEIVYFGFLLQCFTYVPSAFTNKKAWTFRFAKIKEILLLLTFLWQQKKIIFIIFHYNHYGAEIWNKSVDWVGEELGFNNCFLFANYESPTGYFVPIVIRIFCFKYLKIRTVTFIVSWNSYYLTTSSYLRSWCQLV
jgi:hypothetical protein